MRLRSVCCSGAILAGVVLAASVGRAQPAAPAPGASDMAMPDDLGRPLDDPDRKPGRSAAAGALLSVDSPVGDIAADPRGKAILDKDVPGLCERPEYVMFKGMSLRQLQPISHGRLPVAAVERVQADLAAQRIALAPRRSRNPLIAGERAVGRVTHAIYRRVVLVVASL